MKNTSEMINLLNRAAAALETPDDLTAEEKQWLAEELAYTANDLELSRRESGHVLVPSLQSLQNAVVLFAEEMRKEAKVEEWRTVDDHDDDDHADFVYTDNEDSVCNNIRIRPLRNGGFKIDQMVTKEGMYITWSELFSTEAEARKFVLSQYPNAEITKW